ncbi:MAG TPA: hypothetical protein VFO69_13355 [Allosphingosinicella sp.]|nr:hypothetical protein [Allosphingosinicella sp.]
MRLAAFVLLLAACQQAEPPANQAAAAPIELPKGDVSVAEGIVRQRLGNPQNLTFAEAERSASQGVPIICGAFEQNGARQRYIVVGGRDAFIEPQMEAGEMDRAFAEFCGERGRA